jgi:Tol biopolymer transport system component
MGRRPRFSPDGKWVAYWAGDPHSSGSNYIVPAAGGAPQQIPPGMSRARAPVWTPDSKHLLYRGSSFSGKVFSPDWVVAGVDGGTPVRTGVLEECRRANLQFPDAATGSIWPEDWIPGTNEVLFSARFGDSINLWKIVLSPKNWRAKGPPQRVTFGPGPELQASSSIRGRIVFSSVTRNQDIWSLAVDPNRGKALGELRQLTHGAAQDHSPSLSRDGKRMAFESDRTGNQVVWTKDLESGKESMLTDSPSRFNLPCVSPDGTKVAYSIVGDGLFVVPFSGDTPQKVMDGGGECGWTPDGQRVVYGLGQSGSKLPHLEWLDLRTGKKLTLVRHPKFMIYPGHVAPDGGWFSFVTLAPDQTGGDFIARLWEGAAPPENEWIPTRGRVWSPDGNRMWGVLGVDGFRCIWTQRLDPKTKRMVGEPQEVYHSHSARRSLANVGSPSRIGPSLAADKLVFTLGEVTGNIWMAERER